MAKSKEVVYLTPEDRDYLIESLDYLRKLRINIPEPGKLPILSRRPEIYIARVPEGGIPARVGGVPGCAICDIYSIVSPPPTSELDPFDCSIECTLEPHHRGDDEPYREMVFNISTLVIEGSVGDAEYSDNYLSDDVFIAIKKDKFGFWLPDTPGSGGGQIIGFELTDDIDCSLCQARGRVLFRPPGVPLVYGEDVNGEVMLIDVIDPDGGGWLNEPYDDLVGRRGYATLLEMEAPECALDPSVLVYWHIIQLWCGEGGCAGNP